VLRQYACDFFSFEVLGVRADAHPRVLGHGGEVARRADCRGPRRSRRGLD
jgi:hypothetical protein